MSEPALRVARPFDDVGVRSEDATRALWARLEALHAEMSRCYRDLLGEGAEVPGSVDYGLDESRESRHITSVQRTATNDAAPPRRMLSATALATLLDVDPKTIRRWRAEGKLPAAITIGGVVRWRPEDVDAWLAEARS